MLTTEELLKMAERDERDMANSWLRLNQATVDRHTLLTDRAELVELLRLVRGYITKETVTHYQPVDAGYGEAAVLLSAIDRVIHSKARQMDDPPVGDTDG